MLLIGICVKFWCKLPLNNTPVQGWNVTLPGELFLQHNYNNNMCNNEKVQ